MHGKPARVISLKQAETFWIEESRTNPLAFGEYVFGLKPAKHHVKWVQLLLNPDHDKKVIVAPRGSAKTTWLVIVLLWKMSKEPHLCNLLLSVTARQAQDRIMQLTDTIQHSERFHRVFPHIKIDHKKPLTQTQFSLRDTRYTYAVWRGLVTRNSDAKSPTLRGAGVGGSGVLGGRITGILAFDDIMDEKNIRTELLRDQLWVSINQTIIPMLSGNQTEIWHVTTRWHSDDIVERQRLTEEFVIDTTHALYRDAQGILRSYWPEWFPLKKLSKTIRLVGKTVFALMFMNRPTGLLGEIFTADMLRLGLPDHPVPYEDIYISVDAAVTANESSDETAILVIGLWRNERGFMEFHILRIIRGKWQPSTVCERIETAYQWALNKFNQLPVVLVETVAAQKVYIALLAERKILPMLQVDTYTPTNDKATRARPLAGLGETDRLRINTEDPDYHYLVSQFVEFTGKKNVGSDDLVDAASQVAQYRIGDILTYVETNADVKYVVSPHLL